MDAHEADVVVKVLAGIHFVCAGLFFIAGALLIVGGSVFRFAAGSDVVEGYENFGNLAVYAGLTLLCVSLLSFVVAHGLWVRHRGGRQLTINVSWILVVAAVVLFLFLLRYPVTLMQNLMILLILEAVAFFQIWVMKDAGVKELFEKREERY